MKSIKLAIIAITNLALLFLLQWVPVSIIGTGISTDMLFSALIIPQVIAAIFSSNLLQVLMPVIVEEKNSIQNGTFGSIAFIIAISFAALYLLFAYYTPLLTRVIYSQYDNTIQNTISSLIQLSLIGSFFTTMVATYSAAYYTQKKAFLIEIFGATSGLFALFLMMYVLSEDNIEIAVWSINFRWALCFTLLFIFSKSKKLNRNYKEALKKISLRLKNLVVGGAIYKTDVVVDRYFSAQAMTGDLTILHIIQQVFAALSALLNRVLLAPNSPQLTKLNNKKHTEGFQQLFQKIIKKVLFLNILCFFGLLLACLINSFIPEIKIANTLIDDWLYVALLTSGMILGGTLGGVFTVRYYSKGNTMTPTKVSLFSFLNGCLLKLAAFSLFGFSGLLIARSVNYIITTCIYYTLYRQESLITNQNLN